MPDAPKKLGLCIDNTCESRIVPREEWGALPARETIEKQSYDAIVGAANTRLRDIYKRVIVHNSGIISSASLADVQAKSMFKDNFDDTAYHYYIGSDGTIYEGRNLKYMGAHAGSVVSNKDVYNLRLDPDYGSIGISLAGCFDKSCGKDESEPTKAQESALLSLVLYLKAQFPKISSHNIMGHKDVTERIVVPMGQVSTKKDETRCPGAIYPFVEMIAQWVDAANSPASTGAIKSFAFTAPANNVSFRGVRFRPDKMNLDFITDHEHKTDWFSGIWADSGTRGAMINGGYFDALGRPKGLLIKDGNEVSAFEYMSPYSGLMAVDKKNRWNLIYLEKDEDDQFKKPKDISDYSYAMQAGPMIIEPGGKDGIPKPKEGQTPITTERAIIARSKTGEWFFITSTEASLDDIQTALRQLVPNIDAAMNLDGGPSVALAAEGAGVVVKPATDLPVVLKIGVK